MLSIGTIAARIFGTSNDRKVKAYRPDVTAIQALEPEIAALTDAELTARTAEFRRQLADGASLDDILVPAFATVREAAKRTLGQRHFDVQMIGGMVLHGGDIAEMKTGEGKTLVATLAVYLNALAGKGVHVVTVNDYLAKRDADWMGAVYKFLGLSVGCIVHGLEDHERRDAYACDVTYGTNNEYGFDYLRDNMKMRAGDMVQRGHFFAIVDEVDSILVDEARTPLIISGPVEDRAELYNAIDALMPRLKPEHFDLDEKQRQCSLTESGNEYMEEVLREVELIKEGSLYDIENDTVVHHLNQALKAHKLFQRDKDYIVKDNGIVIIDEFTGRMMQGRRYSEGLHQALEAKEKVEIQPENQTLASITFQNYFRLYDKLAGMTGTAATEADEFMDIYRLDVIDVPTNVDIARRDEDDEVYRTQQEKSVAIVAEIADCMRRGQPVLVGTTSIEKSEQLSELLKDRKFVSGVGEYLRRQADPIERIDNGGGEIVERVKKHKLDPEFAAQLLDAGNYLVELGRAQKANADPIPHQVLNARYHEQEASIIAQAGVPGAVTIATNMAGRGTDIQLGGNVDYRIRDWQKDQAEAGKSPSDAEIAAERARIQADITEKKQVALAAGGLYVIGTERHESRRIDNQLRGRSGRQGDPGRSKFYLSLEDDLMRIFGSGRMDGMLQKLGLKEGEAIIHPWINKALEKAQQKVEARNFDSRKYVLKYDDVMNDQRKVIFEQRIDIMGHDDVGETVADMRHQVVHELVTAHIPENAYAEQWDTAGLTGEVKRIFDVDVPVAAWAAEEGIANEEIHERVVRAVDERANSKIGEIGREILRQYGGAKTFLEAVEGEPPMQSLMQQSPTPETLALIGKAAMASSRDEIRIQGISPEEAEKQIDAIGYAVLERYASARGLVEAVDAAPSRSEVDVGRLKFREIEKSVLLQTLDNLWREHLVTLEHLRQVIGFRAYGQRDPVNEYKSEGFHLFETMLANLREATTGQLMHLSLTADSPPPPSLDEVQLPPMQMHHINPQTGEDELALVDAAIAAEGRPPPRPEPERRAPVQTRKVSAAAAVDPADPATWGRVSRNVACPCGSGKKYKHCHGKHG